MFIERPPLFYRMLFPETIWRLPCKEKTIYLTFDDGPVPEITPWVLNLLDYYDVKATFFCVGENVARNTELYAEILKRGHHTGNHTMNHIQGTKYSVKDYVRNVDAANELYIVRCSARLTDTCVSARLTNCDRNTKSSCGTWLPAITVKN